MMAMGERNAKTMEFLTQINHTELPSDLQRDLPFSSLTALELEALDNLDRSIKVHDVCSGEEVEQDTSTAISETGNIAIVQHSFQPFKLAAIPETREARSEFATVDRVRDDSKANKKINAGYILFDGSEIKYITHKTGTLESIRAPSVGSDKGSSIRSRASTITQISSDIPVNFSLSLDELLGHEYLKGRRLSVTLCRRLPTNAHFSACEKLYFFFLGVAPTIAFNAILMSVAYFYRILGVQVLSVLGSCHNVSVLIAMLLVFFSNKNWFPFLPTVTASLVLMAGVIAVFPSFAASDVTLPVYAIYGLVCLNGLCTGFSQAVIDKMVVLFPGGKSSSLVRCGAGFGCLLPALVQIILILVQCEETNTKSLIDYNTFSLYVLFPVAFLGILLGFFSVIKLRRSGIYGLFADKDNAVHSPKHSTISSSSTLSKIRCRKIAIFMISELFVAAVSFYAIALAPNIHAKTLTSNQSNSAPFWKMYLTTVFLGLFKFGDFFGTMLGTLSGYCCKPQPKVFQSVLYLMMAILRLGFVAVVVFFIWVPFLVYQNIFMMGFFLVLALSNGFLTVGIATHCQSICGIRRKDLCPVVSQITWLCIQMGSVIGVALSFVHLS